VVAVEGMKVYGTGHRLEYLKQVKQEAIRHQLERLYALLDVALEAQEQSLAEVVRLGRRYPEIAEFDKVPGVGVVGSHLFDAYIQTPDRFETKRQVWRYCQLGVTDRSSDGKPLGFRRLDRAGNSELKAMSCHAWQTALGGHNEVNEFYQRSLARTQDRVAARLNTQRKILATLWGLWKRKENYRKELFLGSA
jgi:transposase